jgi:hypothetical protein
MADDVIANAGAGGATFRAFSDGTIDWPAAVVTYVTGGSAGAWTLQQVDATHGLPSVILAGTAEIGNVKNSGTFAVQAAQSGTWNITNISGTVSLPTGAATAVKQPALGTAGTASADVITVQGIASMTALKVDGSAVTQPVSGTVTANAGSNLNTSALALEGGGNLATLAGAIVSQGTALGAIKELMIAGSVTTNAPTYTTGQISPLSIDTAGLARVSLKDTPANTNNLNVNLAASAATVTVSATNLSTNVAQLAGTATDVNSGAKSNGTLRVVIATDQPQLTNKLLVTPDANSAVNVAQINGVATTMGNGVSGTGVQRVTLASDSTGQVTLASGAQVQPIPGTSGGLAFTYFTSAANNNKTQVKGSAGQLYFISVQSIHSAPVYLKVFNNTSAGVTAGTTAADYQFMCPANSTAANGAGVVFNFEPGIAMSTGITVLLTLGIGTTDNTSTAANIAVVTIGYK